MDEKQKQQEFLNALNAFFQEHGYHLEPSPRFIPTNHGSFEISVQLVVAKNPQQE